MRFYFYPEEGNDDPDHTQDTDETQLSGLILTSQNITLNRGVSHQKIPQLQLSVNASLPDLLDTQNTLKDDVEDEIDTFGHIKPWDDHDHAQVHAESEVQELAYEEIANMQRPKGTRKKPTLISFHSKSQDIPWTESSDQSKLALMKAYEVEVRAQQPKTWPMRRPCTIFTTTNKCHANAQVQGPQEKEWMNKST
jgi:hypothetical protein